MESINLFIASHTDNVRIPACPLAVPIQVGSAQAPYKFPGFYHDDEGANISTKNASYCELTALYWIWKHQQADYCGLLHYRRYFNFSDTELPITNEPFVFNEAVLPSNDEANLDTIAFNEQAIRAALDGVDFIAPIAYPEPNGESVYDQYKGSVGHHIEDLDLVLGLINEFYPHLSDAAQRYVNGKNIYCCNMFIMRKQLFDDYCAFLFDILQKFEERKDISDYAPVDARVHGYLGERICGMYITYLYDQGFAGKELQRVYFRDTSVTPFASPEVIVRGDLTGHAHVGLELKTICRGEGTVIVKLTVDNPPAEYQPCVLVRFGEIETHEYHLTTVFPVTRSKRQDAWQLELPISNADMLVSAKIYLPDKRVVASLNKHISQQAAMITSKAGSLLNRRAVKDARSLDKAPIAGSIQVNVVDVIPVGSTGCVVQITVTESFRRGTAITDPFKMEVLNADGCALPIENMRVMRDRVNPNESYTAFETREMHFSLRMENVPDYLLVFASRGKNTGFYTIESHEFQSLVSTWRNRYHGASSFAEYHDWFLREHRTSVPELAMQRKTVHAGGPLFSIIVPLYKTPLPFFADMVQSVVDQTYGNWELLLVNASPEDEELAQAAERATLEHTRIKLITLEGNFGITENTNYGIDAATGDYICFFDHDDVIEPDALFEYARRVTTHPETDLLYCDEDKLSGETYCDPYFKPDFNIDLLYGINYVCHFLCVSRRVIERMERPTSVYDGAQDYNMTFWAAEAGGRVEHVGKILYHWRIHENSTASTPDEKPYTQEAARLCIEHHLARKGIPAHAIDSPRVFRHYEVRYDLPAEQPLVSIVIPSKNCTNVLERCVTSIFEKSTYQNFEIVIVDNQSDSLSTFDLYERLTADHTNVRVYHYDEPFNFSAEVNLGVEHARGDYVILLNNDTEVITPDWIERMLGPCMRADMGAVGVKLLFPDDTVQHAGVGIFDGIPGHLNHRLPREEPGYYDNARLSMDLSIVTAACMMVKTSVYNEMGGFDTAFKANYNDVDFCLKLRQAGYTVLFEAGVELYHYESFSRPVNDSGRASKQFVYELALLQSRWPVYFAEGDPFYNKVFSGPYFEISY